MTMKTSFIPNPNNKTTFVEGNRIRHPQPDDLIFTGQSGNEVVSGGFHLSDTEVVWLGNEGEMRLKLTVCINRTQITQITRIFADKTNKNPQTSASSASSVFHSFKNISMKNKKIPLSVRNDRPFGKKERSVGGCAADALPPLYERVVIYRNGENASLSSSEARNPLAQAATAHCAGSNRSLRRQQSLLAQATNATYARSKNPLKSLKPLKLKSS